MNYLSWGQRTVADFSGGEICRNYEDGYVFTRIGKGLMRQTRSVRIDLSKFEADSENRRILQKTGGIGLTMRALPVNPADYDWAIGKLAKDFYGTKFGPSVMSAQKIKEMMTDQSKSNYNKLLIYTRAAAEENARRSTAPLGYAICHENGTLLHYSYPFYDLAGSPKDMGLGMMVRAIQYAKKKGLRYIYLGSLQRPGDTYKLQFSGLEWFDGGPGGRDAWRTDLETVKKMLKSNPPQAA